MSISLFKQLRGRLFRPRNLHPEQIRHLIDQRNFDEARNAIPALNPEIPDIDAEKLSLLGELSFHERRDEDAMQCFQEALLLQPGLPSAHYGMSLLFAERGEFNMATKHAQFSAGANPGNARILAQLGYCHVCLGNMQAAEAPLITATRLNPDNPFAWNNLGIVAMAKKTPHEAKRYFENAVRLKPDLISASHHLEEAKKSLETAKPSRQGIRLSNLLPELDQPGLTQLIETEQYLSALEFCEQWSLENNDDEVCAIALLHLHEITGDPQSGLESLKAWLSHHPSPSQAHKVLGLAYLRTNEFSSAEAYLNIYLNLDPDDFESLEGQGLALGRQEKFHEAKDYFNRALAIEPENTELMGLCAANLANICQYEEALSLCERLQENGVVASCYGPILAFLGRFKEAEEMLDKALIAQPQDANLRVHRASIKLLNENFGGGWDDYVSRTLANSTDVRVLPFPLWRGEALEGKKIIVLAEQGLGDQVMFASCLPDLLARAPGQVVVEVIDRAAETIARSFPECKIVPTKQNHALDWVKDHPDADFFISIGDLPSHFRRSRESFPIHQGYLNAAPAKSAYWLSKTDAFFKHAPANNSLKRKPRIGFSWRGGTVATRTSLRTLPATSILDVTKAHDVDLICLQYGKVETDLKLLSSGGKDIAYWAESISDLDDFASLIHTLDLVITVCNTTVHYAGALGKQVWVMAPKIPEWRYGLTSQALPWYPSSRIFRQTDLGDWEDLLQQVHESLGEWIHQFHARATTLQGEHK